MLDLIIDKISVFLRTTFSKKRNTFAAWCLNVLKKKKQIQINENVSKWDQVDCSIDFFNEITI